MSLIDKLKDEQKAAMKAKDKLRLGTIRMALAAIKQIEIDDKKTLNDDEITAVLTKAVKQRRESVSQYTAAGRAELAEAETAEIAVLEEFLPQQLTEQEISDLIDAAIADTGADGMKDMGKVMGALKPKMAGRADMSAVNGVVKQRLSN